MFPIIQLERPFCVFQKDQEFAVNRQAVELPWRHPIEERMTRRGRAHFNGLFHRAVIVKQNDLGRAFKQDECLGFIQVPMWRDISIAVADDKHIVLLGIRRKVGAEPRSP